MMIHCS